MKVYRTIGQILANHPFFEGMAPDDVDFVAGCGRIVRFDRDEYLFHEDTPADRFFIIREGRVALELFVPERGPIITETVDEGDVIGWSWLFPPYRWSSDARALEPVRAVVLDGACLRRKCSDDPRLGYEMMGRFARIIMRRLRATRFRLLDLYGNDGSSR